MAKEIYHNNKVLDTLYKAKLFFMFDDKKTGRKKVYASLWAVFFGLFITSLIFMILGNSGSEAVETSIFDFVSYLFKFTFDELNRKQLLLFFIFFGFTGLAVSLGFKSGLFNIGVSGQMTFPAIIFFAILINSRIELDKISVPFLIVGFILFILGGLLIGAISGFLKSYFKVHEVISTIFLNWIITYLAAWLFIRENYVFGGEDVFNWFDSIEGTALLSISKEVTEAFTYFGIALLLVLALIIWFIYSKTTIGYKIKMVGLNKTNAKYVGVNEKLLTIAIMSLSGALVGIGGFFYIVLKDGHMTGQRAPLAIGFESIAIALIALNSPIGVIFTSVLYSGINVSQSNFENLDGSQKLTSDFFPIITGLIIFMAALAIIFYKFRPVRTTAKYSYLITNKEYWLNFKTYWISLFKYVIPVRFKLISEGFKHISRVMKYKNKEKEYQNNIAKMISGSSKKTDDELLEMYSEISKLRFEHQEDRYNAGLSQYLDLKNKYKNQVRSRKNNYKKIKEKLFVDFLGKTSKSIENKLGIKEEIMEVK